MGDYSIDLLLFVLWDFSGLLVFVGFLWCYLDFLCIRSFLLAFRWCGFVIMFSLCWFWSSKFCVLRGIFVGIRRVFCR